MSYRAPVADIAFALAAVAGQSRHIRHERGTPPGQAVEESRLADIRPADDGDRG